MTTAPAARQERSEPTICVNLTGCGIIGMLGGLTTCSTFGLDTFALARGGRYTEPS